MFCLTDHRVRVRRLRGHRAASSTFIEQITVRKRGIIVWGVIVHNIFSSVLRITSTLKVQNYAHDFLQLYFHPNFQGVSTITFHPYNALLDTACLTLNALEDVQVLLCLV